MAHFKQIYKKNLTQFKDFARKSSAKRASTILGMSLLLSYILQIGAYPILLRLYAPAHYGLFSLITGLATLLLPLATMRSEQLIQLVPNSIQAARVLGGIIYLGAAISILFTIGLLLLDMIADEALPQSFDPVSICYAGVLTWTTGVNIAVRYGLLRVNRAGTASLALVVRPIAFLAFALLIPVLPGQAADGHGLLLAQLLADLCANAVSFAGLPARARRIACHFHWTRLRPILVRFAKTSLTLVSTDLLSRLGQYLPLLMIAYFFGAREVGWFSIALRIAFVPITLVTSAIGDVFYRHAAERHRCHQDFSVIILKIMGTNALGGLVLFGALYGFSEQIAVIGIGAQWSGAGNSLRAMAILAYFAFISRVTDRTALILGKNRYLVVWHATRLVAIALICTLPKFGVTYDTWLIFFTFAMIASYAFDAVCQYLFAKRNQSA